MKKLLTFIFVITTSIYSAQINRYLRKATRAIDVNHLEVAKKNLLKAYAIDSTDYDVNLGMGYLLSEYFFKYEDAIPYLERAYKKSPIDTFPDLLYSLAKCYQHRESFPEAYSLYNNVIVKTSEDKTQDHLYTIELKKRAEDCLFAEKNKGIIIDKNIYVGNLGSKINTDMPEYVPVITDKNELIFTSRRKDTKKEKRSHIDDKYFENIYISKLINGKPQPVSIFTLPQGVLKTKTNKRHLSIISSTNDGKDMFVFQQNKIFEINTDSNDKKTVKELSKNINIDYYQNHASRSKDGKTLFFTSEDERGNGGLDIYKSIKTADGNWGVPENLGKVINTEYDEDSPYLSDDGQTLYFSSKGHPGFGNYDIFKSKFENGEWSQPENLELPINSAGDDIFLTQANKFGNDYFSSSRTGGFGDMDIYKITYLDKFKKECANQTNPLVTINSKLINKDMNLVNFEASLPSTINALSYQWTFNQSKLAIDTFQTSQNVSNTSVGDSIYVKVIAGCDTCIEPIVLCNYLKYKKPKEDVLVSVENQNTNIVGKNPYDDKLALTYLNKNKIEELGLNMTPIHFNLNKSNIRKDAIDILTNNINVLSKHPELSVIIYGFADSRGSEAYNLPLSKKRAQHVKKYLISKGVNANQIEQVYGQGERFIINKCTEGVACEDIEHEINRRVEFIIFEKK